MTDTQERTNEHQMVGWILAMSCVWAGLSAANALGPTIARWIGA